MTHYYEYEHCCFTPCLSYSRGRIVLWPLAWTSGHIGYSTASALFPSLLKGNYYSHAPSFAASFAVLGYVGSDRIPDLVVSGAANETGDFTLYILQPVPDNSSYATVHVDEDGQTGPAWGKRRC